jgi:CheY-like chemotaxis protein
VSAPQRPFSLLLVDDDDVAAEAVVRGLHKHGVPCPIVIAEDGTVALQILRGGHPGRRIHGPRLVLLDLNMRGMNGFEFLRELRADAALHGTVVFVLTTSDADSDVERAYDLCIAGYLVKSALGPQLAGLARFLMEYGAAAVLPAGR